MREVQKWFGAMIAQPLQTDHKLPPTTPFRTETKTEAAKYIAPSPTLQPYQRIEIYHQQYWWRLLKSLQNNFPTVTRLFGYDAFNQMLAIPYLSANPPTHWALCRLGETFPEWIRHHYPHEDLYLVAISAEIDWAAQRAFWIGTLPSLDTETRVLTLQPHLHLFHLQADFFTFREIFLKQDVKYYTEHPFPDMEYGDYYFVVFRTLQNRVSWKKLSAAEFFMLSLFKGGNTLDKACAQIEEEGGAVFEEAEKFIPLWFKQWTELQWFGQFL